MARVLIVDDEPSNRLLLSSLVRYAGHVPYEAADGAQGLLMVKEERPDLVIVDLYMPVMNGVEFITALRRDAETANVAVALYTGTSMNASIRDFMRTFSIEHVIPKPAEPGEILRALEAALG